MNAEVTQTQPTPLHADLLNSDLESLVIVTMTSSAINPGKAAAGCCCCSSSCCCVTFN